ncbi:MAG: hypothetical protein V4507_00620 [Verrucomicrobiota bacterium]
MKKQITRISPHQTSKIVAILYSAVTVIFIPIGIAVYLAGGKQKSLGLFLILAPLIYGVISYLMFGFVCLVYNLVAKRFGGVEFEVKEVSEVE